MVEIVLPPLRERMEDIPELARYFLDGLALQYGSAPLMVADHALERMERYQWPGNVSELERVLRCGALRSEGPVIESYHLPVFAEESMERSPKIEAAGSLKLQDMVEQHVLRVLKDCAGNKLRAAELLGISRSTLYRMLDTCAVGDRLRP
jgi:DNA-binding NtrC family response regulator